MLNQYTIVNSNQPTYDDDGNMLTNGNWSYTWNGENRLSRAENSATGVKLEFAYDYMGRRIFKKVYNGEILEKHLSFVYDGYKLIEERNALDSNAAVRKHVWQPESLDRDVPLTVYDVASDKTYYYHTDANKNVTELSDEAGNIVAHYEYSPFGSLTKVTGDYAGSNPFRFSSEYYDEETGLIYYNYRYYNPELGRWISRDPIEEQGGFNLYGMIGNNPLYKWDRLGYEHAFWCFLKRVFWGAVSGAVTGALSGAAVGAAIGAVAGAPGAVAGASVGAVSGAISGAISGGFSDSTTDAFKNGAISGVVAGTTSGTGTVAGATWGATAGITSGAIVGGIAGGINGYISSGGNNAATAWGVAAGAFAGGCSGYNAARVAQGAGNPKADLTSVIAGVDTDVVGNVVGKAYKETK